MNVVSICELEFLSDVLSPGGVEFDLVGVERALEKGVPEVGGDHWCPLVESFHSSLAALDVLSVQSELLVDSIDGD